MSNNNMNDNERIVTTLRLISGDKENAEKLVETVDKFFDTIDHKRMLKLLERRIHDPNFPRRIGRSLKVGILENRVTMESDIGTPQGGVLNPIPANIYLHYTLDKWFQDLVKKRSKGFAELTRYADDFIACFEHKADAQAFRTDLEKRLQENRLKAYREKNKVMAVGEWLKKIRNLGKMPEWLEVLKMKLEGHYQYYGKTGNYNALKKFYYLVERLAMKWSNRRSQNKSYTWERFNRLLQRSPLPKPRICHKANIRGCISEKLYEGKTHVRFCEGGPANTPRGVAL